MAQQIKQYLNNRLEELKKERQSYFVHWQDLSDYIQPRRGRFLVANRNKGSKRNNKIIDSTGTLALRTLASGMMSGLTSPARPWFKLDFADPALSEIFEVKLWLSTVETRMREVFSGSNIYNSLHTSYSELGLFGTASLIVVENFKNHIWSHNLTAGEYLFALNDEDVVDTMYREYQMTTGQLEKKYGKENLSRGAQDQLRNNQYDLWHTIRQAIEPNTNQSPAVRKSRTNMPWVSYHWELSSTVPEEFLRKSGFEEFPVMGPRWDVNTGDFYGRSPGMDALGDVKQLQSEQKRKSQAIDKMADPPMIGSSKVKAALTNTLPGGLTIVDSVGLGLDQAFRTAYQVNIDISHMVEDIREVQGRINAIFYKDLFLMLSSTDRREITAREVEERHEEKLLMLGPVLERVETELLDPLIDRTFQIMFRKGIIPPPPAVIQGEAMRVEYIGLLAQAQRLVEVSGIERMVGFINIARELDPQMADKFDGDEAINHYSRAVGIKPDIIRSDDDVAAMRQARAEEAQRQQAAAAMAQLAESVGKAGQVSSEPGNVVSDTIRGLT